MPLLGKKQFSLAKTLTNVGSDEEIYTIQHTQERFRSKDEYDKRVELYKQGIWTCRCTGHTTLTHEEALKSEQAALKTLRAQFPELFEKTVLQIVHHSTESLDALNDQAWTKLHQVLVEGEAVSFKVNNGAKTLKGSVIGISPNVEDASTTSSKCNSPSSDKENNSDGKKSPKKWTPPKLLPYKYSVKLEDGPIINSVPVEDLIRTERPPSKDIVRLFIRSNAVRCGTNNTSPWVVDEPLVKKYALPSKFADFLLSPAKMAEAAKRAEELGKKRKRQSQDGGAAKKRKLGDTAEKKDKSKNKLTPVSLNKKVKQPKDSVKTEKKKDSDKAEKKKKEKKENSVQKKSSPDKSKMKPSVIEISDSSDEEVSLATIKKMKTVNNDDDSDLDVPLASLADQGTPKKKTSSSTSGSTPNKQKKSDTPKKEKKTPGTPKVKKTDDQKSPGKRKRADSTDSDIPLSKLTPSTPQKSAGKTLKEKNETTPSKTGEKRGRGRPKKGEEKGQKVQTISRKFLTKTLKGRYATIQDALNSVEKGESVRKAALDNNIPYETLRRVSKQGGWKQMTLLEITSKNKDKSSGSGTTPKKTPVKKSPPKPQTPLIVKKLLSLNKDEDRHKFNVLMKKAVLVLTPSQKKNLPSPLKEKVQRRIELMEERKALEKMSETEREAYLKEKKEKQKRRMKEKLKEKMKEMRQRYEDQDLKLQPLPAPKLVPTPDNLPNELFGDVAMVTEFISSYSGLLMPESEYPIYTDALMKALAGGSQGFAYLSRVLCVLLQTLLQDEIAEGYSELKVPLNDIAVNPYTASELVRLCLRKDDGGGGDADNDDEELEVPDSLIQQLESQEFFQLECEEKLKILRGLCLRVMGTYSIQDYMEEKQREAVQLTKQRVTEMKGFNEKLKEKKQKGEDKNSANNSAAEDAPTNGPAVLTINSFYGKKLEDSSANDSPADSQGEEGGENLVSIVKRRRLMAAKAAQEKEKRDLEKKLKMEKEFQEERERRQREMFETKYKDSISLARTVLRHVPIGYDRYHNRYWMFTFTTPGLYIEKGWVSQEIGYNPGEVPDEREAEEKEAASSSTPSSSPTKEPGSPSKRLRLTKKKALVESTIPTCGQNLWFTYNSLKDLDTLLHNLHPQGIREAALKTEIRKRYQEITRAIQNYQRNNLELRDSDGNEEMVASFKKELSDIETRLRNGGLGGVQNFDTWETKLMSATDIAVMGECLLETHDGIMDKFLQKFMKLPKKEEQEDVKKEEEEEEAEDGDDEEEKSEVPEDKKLSAAEKKLQQWKDSVANCSTVSRLHVLLSMMDSCIKWEKSAENAKCKICRKKGDDDRLLLCDECNQAFHMYCLRPQLIHVPRGDWFCAACVPHTKRRSLAPCRIGDETDSEEDEAQRTNCEECGGEAGDEEGEELVACHKCPSVYHLECHQPPLRRVPRGVWECNDCKNGIRRRKKGRLQRKAASRKSYKRQVQDDEDESEEEEEEEEEESEEEESEEEAPKPAPKTSRAASKASTTRRSGRHAENASSSYSSTRSSGRSSDHHDEAPIPRSRRNPSDLSLCEDILQKLMKHSSSWPFLEPVNKKQVPDYHQIIKKPMDFQTMLKKCARLSYSSPQEFVDDAILVFSNAAKYNELDSEVYSCMKEVEKFFAELLAKYLPDYASTQHFVADTDVTARTRRTRRN